VGVLAALMAASTFAAGRFGLRGLPDAASTSLPAPASSGRREAASGGLSFRLIVVVFAVAAFANPAFTANLVPALGERTVSPTTAAVLGGLLGVMQLPGRALVMSGRFAGAPARLALVSLLLQAAGFVALGSAASVPVLALAIAVFGAGAGLTTLVRPHLVQTVFGMERAGALNGRLARSQQIARAAGPILAGWLGSIVGYSSVFLLLGAVIAVLAAVLHRSARPTRRSG
jgi:predicted MFS family arabinose efflux permease